MFPVLGKVKEVPEDDLMPKAGSC